MKARLSRVSPSAARQRVRPCRKCVGFLYTTCLGRGAVIVGFTRSKPHRLGGICSGRCMLKPLFLGVYQRSAVWKTPRDAPPKYCSLSSFPPSTFHFLKECFHVARAPAARNIWRCSVQGVQRETGREWQSLAPPPPRCRPTGSRAGWRRVTSVLAPCQL